MKSYSLLIAFVLFAVISYAQSQRTILVEECTNASCPPCAFYNPDLNDLLDANSAKVCFIKYQTNWPGTDPMNAQNPSQVSTRVGYYSVSGVPTVVEDGNYYKGSPGNFNQSKINNRYAVTSPFTIDVSHYLSPNHDSIYAHAVITCTKAVTGTLVAQLGIIERTIYFNSPPGSNGETIFPGVMKKMLPTDQGTSIGSSLAVGDVKTIDQKWKLANVYDTNQLAVVVWVQDNATKQVHQAGYSHPHITRDAGIIKGTNAISCTNNINPVVTLHNFTTSPLTSAIINYSLDGATAQTYNWNGNLAADSSVLVSMPPITFADGRHTIQYYTTMPNGAADLNVHNDGLTQTVNVVSTPVNTPVYRGFQGAVFPGTGWSVENVGNDLYTWSRATGGVLDVGSAFINTYTSKAGTVDNIYSPPINFSGAISGSQLSFYVAHAQCTYTQFERLKVDVTTDCGATWTNVYDKIDPALSTLPDTMCSGGFTPTSSQWRLETASLDQFIGSSSILARFQAVSGQGQNIYVDDINITSGPAGIADIMSNHSVSVYPNPSTGETFLRINFDKPRDITVTVSNLLGSVIKSFIVKDANGLYPIDLTGKPEGSYFVNIKTDKEIVTRRIFVTK